MNKYEYATWGRCNYVVDEMYKHSIEVQDKFDVIYAIPRGGCVLGVMLSHKLKIPVQFTQDFSSDKNYLIIDDIADTGKTLKPFTGIQNKKIYTWYYHKQSIVIPDFYVDEKTNKWVKYPWEN